MKLHTREWGRGDRVATLIHGTTSDSRTWHRVGPAVAELGYRVIAVDLRGHGGSPRGYYSLRSMADDLVDTLPARMDIAVGHSMGAALLVLTVDRLRPRRAVYAEPYWNVAASSPPPDLDAFIRIKGMTHDETCALNPGWAAADVDAEIAARTCWDPRTLMELHRFDMPTAPWPPVAPSLVLLAAASLVPVNPGVLRKHGYDVDTVPESRHTMYHDNLPGFLAAIQRWL